MIQSFDVNDTAGMLKLNIRALGSGVPQSHFPVPQTGKHTTASPKVDGKGVGGTLITRPSAFLYVGRGSVLSHAEKQDSTRGTNSKLIVITLMRSSSGGP